MLRACPSPPPVPLLRSPLQGAWALRAWYIIVLLCALVWLVVSASLPLPTGVALPRQVALLALLALVAHAFALRQLRRGQSHPRPHQ